VARHRAREWAKALGSGLGVDLGDLNVTFAYWAPILHAGVPIAQGSGPDPDAALDYLERVDSDTVNLAAAWLEALELPTVTAQGRLAMPLRHAVSMAARRFSLDGRLTKLFVAGCFPEVAGYLTYDPVRIAVRDYVARVIAEQSARIVIAHSLGTVVAFEALHAHPELTLDLLITLGSPLALPHGVFHRLQPRPVDGLGIRPPTVTRWVNVADHGDPVAILRPFDRYFPDVDLDLVESVGLFEFHKVGKYLSSASVAATLQPYL